MTVALPVPDRFTFAWSDNGRAGLARRFALLLPVSVVLAIMQPFETDTVPFAIRLAYWGVLVGLLAALGGIAVVAIHRFLGTALQFAWQRWLACAAIVSLPMIAPVKLLDLVLAVWVAPLAGVAVDPGVEGVEIFSEYLWLYIAAFTIVAIIFAIPAIWAANTGAAAGLPDQSALAERPGGRFLERLPGLLGSDLVSIRTEDHYLRVQTRLGSELLLMRMADAMAELDGYPGCRVHRSWWVALAEIAQVRKAGRRIDLILRDGQQVPVSASHRGELERLL